jgi:hypothetical protein
MMWQPDDEWFARIAFPAMAALPVAERNKLLQGAWDPSRDEELFERAQRNEIAPHIGHALNDLLGAEALPGHWATAHKSTRTRIAAYMQELDRVAALLAAERIPLIGLKNAGIARGIYPCLGCSPMGDLDVLVRRQDFRDAHRVLIEDGYRVKFRSPLEEATLEAGEQGGGMEYLTTLPDGEELWFELQWRPVAGRWIRPDQEPSGDELVARSISIEGTDVRLLDPVDNLLQVCLHTAKHSYVRAPGLRLHTDVDRIVRFASPDWDAFQRRVCDLGVRTACYFSLEIPRNILGTPIPDEVLQELRPSSSRGRALNQHLDRAGLFEPEERKFTNLQFLHFTASMYDDWSGLMRAVIPDRQWMKEHYGFQSNLALPFYHARRLVSLVSRRTL